MLAIDSAFPANHQLKFGDANWVADIDRPRPGSSAARSPRKPTKPVQALAPPGLRLSSRCSCWMNSALPSSARAWAAGPLVAIDQVGLPFGTSGAEPGYCSDGVTLPGGAP